VTPLALVRAVNIAASAVTLGVPAVLVLVVAPLCTARQTAANEIFRRLLAPSLAVIAIALVVELVSGALWLFLQAASMSGRSPSDAAMFEAVETVLARTGFGHASLARLGFAVALALCLLLLRRARAERVPALLAATSLAGAGGFVALAWTGHAAATEGTAGILHLIADGSHLLAAGVWLGGLVALAMFFGAVRAAPRAAAIRVAAAVSRRFSPLGILCVATLTVSGIVNSWLLVGDLPHLLGTEYGRLLLVKIALFAAMVAVAAYNRTSLTPRIAAATRDDAMARWALAGLQRNCIVEAILGLAVVGVVGLLGQLPPGLHDDVWWPFAWRLSGEALLIPDINRDVGIAILATALGAMLLVVAAVNRATRLWAVPAGLALIVFFVATPFRLLSVAAFPTSFQRSPVPYATASIARGKTLFEANCAACHGATGRGDGAAGAELSTRPADLNAPHVLDHPEGELFWWIGNGIADTPMPGFAATLDPEARWDLVNFVRTLPLGGLPEGLAREIGNAAPPAPDFPFELADGSQATLRDRVAEGPLLLVLADNGASAARQESLAAMRQQLAEAGLAMLVLPGTAAEAAPRSLPTAMVDPSVREVYRLIAAKLGGQADPLPTHLEFLIDRNGFIRALARGLGEANAGDATRLLAQVRLLDERPLAPLAAGPHIH
jgi:putative copper export protein/mono/diheme cytochrome c family protein